MQDPKTIKVCPFILLFLCFLMFFLLILLHVNFQEAKFLFEDVKGLIKNLKAKDLTELYEVKKPTKPMQKILEAVLILHKENDLSWNSAQKILKSRERLIQSCEAYKPEKIKFVHFSFFFNLFHLIFF